MDVNLSEVMERLAQPFAETAIYWRAGTVSKDRKRAQALPYADPRVYEDRLNSVCPELWSVTFKPWGDSRIICDLTIAGVTRSSTGEENEGFAPGTAAEAQAFKRACSKFGLGRYLYDLPINWVAFDDEHKRLLEEPKLPQRYLPQVGVLTLSPERAQTMQRELEKLGLPPIEQNRLATTVLGFSVENLTALTEAQALEVWNRAKRETSKRSLGY